MSVNALLVVDVQNDFCPGGALPVGAGDEVVGVLNAYIRMFSGCGSLIFASRDWHPAQTRHFKEWPPHCLAGTSGAMFHPGLRFPADAVIISKGMTPDADGYSAFQGFDAEGVPFVERLRRKTVDTVYIGGLATDYCVKHSVLDALGYGLRVYLLMDGVRGVNLRPDDERRAVAEMVSRGAYQMTLHDMEDKPCS